ncbi:hypothetical protein [Tsukamurella pseudospumae]|uniref:hypothetical protein n=1 Tax=Tsukamurella pseudospumae TaxID=239498 RepID=UPI000839A5EC|nr:hypothetical protein [Tsukamurella pseudospumae]
MTVQIMETVQWWTARSQESRSSRTVITAVGDALLDWLRWGVSLAVATWIMMALPLNWAPNVLRAAATLLLTILLTSQMLRAQKRITMRATRESA